MTVYTRAERGTPETRAGAGVTPGDVEYDSQRVAYPYFLVSAVLFFLQVIFGLIIAAQYVWPTWLMDSFPFNFGRATHLNLLILWLLLGLMGATYYLIPEESKSELFSVPLAYVQLAVLLVAGLGTLSSFWFLGEAAGKPFTESPMPWPLLIALGVVLFLINVGLTLYRSGNWTAVTTVLFFGMVGLAVLYLINMVFIPNLVVDYFWWWWIIHLWVEGTWELVAASVTAYLLIKLTGVERKHMARWLYLEVALVMFAGIIGIGHHYYWIGTPRYWLILGAVFSSFEPLPIALMTVHAFKQMEPVPAPDGNRAARIFLIGSAVGHFFGAGVWGFAQTLPQINQYTHGTQVTASHGHFAFFGAFGMLVLSAAYFIVPKLQGLDARTTPSGTWSFRLMTTGMLAMVSAFTIAGVVQTYLWRLIGMDFMVVRDQYVSFWIFWVWFFGLVLFLPGTLLYLRDFFWVTTPVEVSATPEPA